MEESLSWVIAASGEARQAGSRQRGRLGAREGGIARERDPGKQRRSRLAAATSTSERTQATTPTNAHRRPASFRKRSDALLLLDALCRTPCVRRARPTALQRLWATGRNRVESLSCHGLSVYASAKPTSQSSAKSSLPLLSCRDERARAEGHMSDLVPPRSRRKCRPEPVLKLRHRYQLEKVNPGS